MGTAMATALEKADDSMELPNLGPRLCQDREVGTTGEERRVHQSQQLLTGLGALRAHGVTRDLALVEVTEIHRLVILVAEAESSIITNHLSPGVG